MEGAQKFRWSYNGTQERVVGGTFVSEGTLPKGSMWAKNPIPSNETGPGMFAPSCEEVADCDPSIDNSKCLCSGPSDPGFGTLEIVDQLEVPAELPAGEYVLGFRWDCEESNQVWASCSDVRIVKA